jgi:hypothetical protein
MNVEPGDELLHELSRRIEVDRLMAHIEQIGRSMPSRLAGTDAGERMAHYSASALQALGLAARVDPVHAQLSLPEAVQLEVLSPQPCLMQAHTFGHSLNTPPEGLVLDVCDAGGASASELSRVLGDAAARAGDISGGASRARPFAVLADLGRAPARHEKQRLSALAGGRAAIFYNWGEDTSNWLPFGSVKPAWGTPMPDQLPALTVQMPCVGVSRRDGLQLAAWAHAGTLVVRLHARNREFWGDACITTASLRGQGSDFIVAGGHQDSWFGPSATDNAAGSAVLLELAALLVPQQSHLRRGACFAFWSGHETGTMAGSAWWVAQHWPTLREHMAAYVEIDQPGLRGTELWETSASHDLMDFCAAAEQHTLGKLPRRWLPPQHYGDASFSMLGMPSINAGHRFAPRRVAAMNGASLGWWHHTQANTIDHIDPERLKQSVKVQLAYLWRLCTRRQLPQRFVPLAQAFVQALQQTGGPAAVAGNASFDRVVLSAAAFVQQAVQLDSWIDRVSSTAHGEAEAALLGDCARRVTRRLLPLAYTIDGPHRQDSYGHSALEQMLPRLSTQLSTPGAPSNAQLQALAAQQQHGCNEILDGLEEANHEIRRIGKELTK